MVSKTNKSRQARRAAPRAGKVVVSRDRKERLRSRPRPNKVAEFAKLVMDPCNGPVDRVAGTSTQGAVVERQRSTLTFPAVAAQNCGYLVWFPSYNGATGIGGNSNLFYWSSASTTLRPINTNVEPLGTTLATSGMFLPDPTAASIPAGGGFTRARCVSACMQLDFIGSLANTAGQVAVIRNLSLAAFNLQTGTVNAFSPMTIDEMFAYAHTRERLSLDGHEVVWRPTDSESVLRTQGLDPANSTWEPDALFEQGNPAINATSCRALMPGNVTGIAICWRGTTASSPNFMSANFVKVAELELAPRVNLTEMVPRPVMGERTSYAQVTDYLDKYLPDWQARSIRMASGVMRTAARTYAPMLTDMFATKLMIKDG